MSTVTSYTPPVDQPKPLPPASPYGGFWVRVAAHFVDNVIISVVSLLLLVAAILAMGLSGGKDVASTVMPLMSLMMLLTGQLYHAYFVSSEKMATPGKRLCGLYVTDVDGHRLSFGHALGRNLAAMLSYLTLYIGFFMAGFTERKQALHDKLTGTLVHRQPGGSASNVVIIIIVLFIGVAVIGILAAIAIPAYGDFTERARVATVLGETAALKQEISDYQQRSGQWPTQWEQLGLSAAGPMDTVSAQTRSTLQNIRLGDNGAIVYELKIRSSEGALSLTPPSDGTTEWICQADKNIARITPAKCRQ